MAGRLICLKWKNGFLRLQAGRRCPKRIAGEARGQKKTAAPGGEAV
jgi:hypothetical protein